jgi:hypothetical protein
VKVGWLTPRTDRLTPLKETWYPIYRRLGGTQGLSGRVRKTYSLPGFDPWTVQPVPSRHYRLSYRGPHSDYATGWKTEESWFDALQWKRCIVLQRVLNIVGAFCQWIKRDSYRDYCTLCLAYTTLLPITMMSQSKFMRAECTNTSM